MKKLLCLILVACVLMLTGCEKFDINSLDFLIPPVLREFDYDEYPQISNVIELRDFIAHQQDEDILEYSFVYTGEEELPEDAISIVSDACFISYYRQGLGHRLYRVTLSEYPGNRIVDAYYSEDTYGLTEKEIKAMEIAVAMVEEARSKATNNWELEYLLYTALMDKITYYSADISYDTPEDQPWYLNAVGALVMGAANCQGYADAFYTVASIAGFQVGRMSVETSGGGHMVNTICLDGKWYVVDVTFGDGDTTPHNYRLFNAGMDMVQEYWWPEECEINPIADVTDPLWFYYYRNGAVFQTQESLARYVAEEWDKTGRSCIYVMLQNQTDSDSISQCLYDTLVEYEKSFSYNVWYATNDRDSFYAVVFEDQ